MKITIDVPELKCARCSTAAPIQPRLLYIKGQVPPELRETISSVLKERSDMSAVDSEGRAWEILADDKPVGWVKGPSASDLCAPCGALWLAAGKAFMVPPPKVDTKAAPVKAEPAKTEIVKAAQKPQVPAPVAIPRSNFGSTAPIPQSALPSPPASLPRR